MLALRLMTAFVACLDCFSSREIEEWAQDTLVLIAAGGQPDRQGLRHYFRHRTPSVSELDELAAQLRLLGDDDYETRERASRTLRRCGGPAVPFLKCGLASDDPEVRARCDACLRELHGEAIPTAAAARRLAALPDRYTARILLDYLPFAPPDRLLEDELLAVLASLPPDCRPPVAVLAALLGDPNPRKRSAAALLLAQSPRERHRRVILPLFQDPTPEVRLRAAQALLPHGESKAIDALLALVTDGPIETANEANQLLSWMIRAHSEETKWDGVQLLREDDTSRRTRRAELREACRLLPRNCAGARLSEYVVKQCRYAAALKEAYKKQLQALEEKAKAGGGFSEHFWVCKYFLGETARGVDSAKQSVRLWGMSRRKVLQLTETQ